MPDWIESIESAWKGHRVFAEWVVNTMNPTTIVELGVDYGYSSFVFASALLKKNPDGRVFGIDHFKGDEQTGVRNTRPQVEGLQKTHGLTNLTLISSDFSEAAATWTTPIDILHIDGLHTYDAVRRDYDTWSKFLSPNGVILFHDIHVPNPSYEVKQLFDELTDGYRIEFKHSAGLGVYTRNRDLYTDIFDEFTGISAYRPSTTPNFVRDLPS